MTKTKNILLVEDDEDDQFFFVQAINEIDNSITLNIAKDGIQAFSNLNKAVILPDIIFMDINLPGMSGLDCLRQLKKLAQFKNIPVVMLTTSNSFDEEQLSNKFGASFFITKPVLYPLLRQNISNVLRLDLSPVS